MLCDKRCVRFLTDPNAGHGNSIAKVLTKQFSFSNSLYKK